MRRHLCSVKEGVTFSPLNRCRNRDRVRRHERRLVSCNGAKTSQNRELVTWLQEEKGVVYTSAQVTVGGDVKEATEFTAMKNVDPDQVPIQCMDIDAERHPEIQHLTKGRSELVQLTLWLMVERSKGEQSLWHPFLKALPEMTLTPVLWTREELYDYCRGSPVVDEAMKRRKALLAEWDSLQEALKSEMLPGFQEEAFLAAFSVVLSYAYYLPNASRFALLPPLIGLQRTGDERACLLDYNTETDMVTLTTQKDYNMGDALRVFDGRPNSELLLATGAVEEDNPSDCIVLDFELVPADRLYSAKRQILESLGYQPKESFPIYMERIPTQLLSFLRLSRIQDPGLLTQASFSEDLVISQLNEYEVLQLVLGECKVRLSEYQDNAEADIKSLQADDLNDRQRIATQLLLGEKKILQSCLDIVRMRLAPIRGVPTKSGQLEDPNKDILDMFNVIESIPQAPKKLLEGIVGWAKGNYDPDWNKKNKKR